MFKKIERRKSTQLLLWVDAIVTSAILAFVINIEHRLTTLETQLVFLMKNYDGDKQR